MVVSDLHLETKGCQSESLAERYRGMRKSMQSAEI